MQDKGETHGAEPYDDSPTGPTFQDALAALRDVLPKSAEPRSDFQTVTEAMREITRLREYAALPQAVETPNQIPGWREIAYEEPPYGKDVLFRRDGFTFVGHSVKPDPEDEPDDGHGLLIRIPGYGYGDGANYEGFPPTHWSEIPDFAYDDVLAIGTTLDGDEPDDSDEDAEDDDSEEVYYRDLATLPPANTPVLLLMLDTENQSIEPFIGWLDGDGAWCVEDADGDGQYVNEPEYWSFLPKPPITVRKFSL